MRTAVIVNQFSAMNAGDAAILRATVELLHDNGFERIVNATRFHREDRDYNLELGVKTCPPIIRFAPRNQNNPLIRLIQLTVSVLCSIFVIAVSQFARQAAMRLARILRQHGLVEALQADTIVFAGGGYIWSAKSAVDFSLWHALTQMWIVRFLNIPSVMMPISIGTITGGLSSQLFRKAFCWLPEVVLRDEPSVAETHRIFQKSPPSISLVPDIVIGSGESQIFETDSRSVPSVVIVPMNWMHTRDVNSTEFERYIQELANISEELAKHDFDVILAGTAEVEGLDESDFDISERVRDKVSLSLISNVSLARPEMMKNGLEGLIAEASLLIGTRLHSCILAMNNRVPAIALAYTEKVNGTYSLLGLSDYCFDVEHFVVEEVMESALGLLTDSPEHHERFRTAVDGARKNIESYYTRVLTV